METPEDVKSQCIFCQLIDGKIPSRQVYEDEVCVAILDINPANPGHVLILPKQHQPIMPLMPEPDAAHLMKVAKKISHAIIRGLNADSTNIFAANGSAAGQKAPHFMLHVIPRKKDDGLDVFKFVKNDIMPEDQQKLVIAIGGKVSEQFGLARGSPEPAAPAEQEDATHENVLPDPDNHPADQQPEPEDAQEEKPKKKFDLDKIGGLFK